MNDNVKQNVVINNYYYNYNYNVNYTPQHNRNYNYGHGSQNNVQQAAAAAVQRARRGKKWYYYVSNPSVPNGAYFQEYSFENQFLCNQLYQRVSRSKKNQYCAITIL